MFPSHHRPHAPDQEERHLKTGRPAKFHGERPPDAPGSGSFPANRRPPFNGDFSLLRPPFDAPPVPLNSSRRELPAHQKPRPDSAGRAAGGEKFRPRTAAHREKRFFGDHPARFPPCSDCFQPPEPRSGLRSLQFSTNRANRNSEGRKIPDEFPAIPRPISGK